MLFGELGDAPDDPLGRVDWMQAIATTIVKETLQGRGDLEVSQEIRAWAGVVARLVPFERVYDAEQTIAGAALPRKPNSNLGPKTTSELGSEPALRGK